MQSKLIRATPAISAPLDGLALDNKSREIFRVSRSRVFVSVSVLVSDLRPNVWATIAVSTLIWRPKCRSPPVSRPKFRSPLISRVWVSDFRSQSRYGEFHLCLGFDELVSFNITGSRAVSPNLERSRFVRTDSESTPPPSPRSFYRARRRWSRDQSVGHVVRSLCKRRRHCQHELHQHSSVFFDTAHILNKVKISKSASK